MPVAGRRHGLATAVEIVFRGNDSRARRDACPDNDRDRLDRFLARASQAIGKAPRGRLVGASVLPEFVPKRNSQPIGNDRRATDDVGVSRLGDEMREPSISLIIAFTLRPANSASVGKLVQRLNNISPTTGGRHRLGLGDGVGRGYSRAAAEWGTRAPGGGGRTIPRSPHRGDTGLAQPRGSAARERSRREWAYTSRSRAGARERAYV